MKMKLFTITISFLLMMSGFFVVVSGEDTGLSVQEDVSEPIEIYDWHDLDEVRDDLDGDYILMNNLDEDTDGYDELVDTEKGWAPIGGEGTSFGGTFDGNGYEIRDLYINRPEKNNVGLFGRISEGAEVNINNLGLIDANIRGNNRVGTIIGSNFNGTLSNLYASGYVRGSNEVGGLIGLNGGLVKNSYTTVEVTGGTIIGGLVGHNYFESFTPIRYIIGRVIKSYSTGNVCGDSQVGGLVGENHGGVSNSYWDMVTSGQYYSDGGTVLQSVEMTGDSAKENMTGFDFENTWDVYDDGTHVSYPYLIDNAQEPAPGLQHVDDIDYFLPVDPDTKSQPYRIENWNHLDKVRIRPGASYKLTTHLDQYTDGYEEVASKMARDGDGFKPIGDSDNRFTGVFDGQGLEIRDLYINRSDENFVGLFGRSEGDIKNLGVVGANVSGKSRVGGLLGWQGNGATVENCYATGEVMGTKGYPISEHVGGLIGVNSNDASVSNSYTVCNVSGVDNIGGLIGYQRNDSVSSNSYAMGNVNGVGDVGGLIGSNSEGTVETSFATGNVVGEWRVGGLIGENNMAALSESYAIGDVSGDEYVGGLVGENNYATVEYSYSSGSVDGDEYVGGLVGRNWAGGEVENSFWDTKASGLETSDGGTGLTTDEMTGENAAEYMDALDYDDIWETVLEDDEDVTEKGYPILQAIDREDQLRAQNVYHEEDDDDDIPGFTMPLLAISVVLALVVYYKKKW